MSLPAWAASRRGRVRQRDEAGRPERDLAYLADLLCLWPETAPERHRNLAEAMFEFEPPGHLLLEFDHPRVEWIRKEGLWPRFGHSTWAFVLRPLDEGRGTRLITRMHYQLPFGIHLLHAIKGRAEGRIRPIGEDASPLP